MRNERVDGANEIASFAYPWNSFHVVAVIRLVTVK